MPIRPASLQRGLCALALILVLALAAATAFSPAFLDSWVSLIMVSMVPTQMVVSLLWQGQWPARAASLPQPWRGLLHTAGTLISAVIIAYLALQITGAGATPPTPFTILYLILSVPVTLALIVLFQAWPFQQLFRSPGLQGLALLAGAYAMTWLLFTRFFNFSFAAQAPFYLSNLDPQGIWTAWLPLTASLAALSFMLVLVLLDFWPLDAAARRWPRLTRQPWRGLTAGLCVAACTALLLCMGLSWAAMDVVVFMTRICVASIFGLFIVLVMLEGVPQLVLPQPWRGLCLTLAAGLLGQLMYALYRAIALWRFGLSGGAAPYALDLWLAASMLAVTFPAMVFFAQYFQFWPLARPAAAPAPHLRQPNP
ncbi:hypothetical protein [Kerstersia similis]|uniref:hypothetical protein n=1 Tax=Kerstersia similis TaxID=206505 RepID=UPI0039F0EE96